MTKRASVVTTVQMNVDHLDADAIRAFASLLDQQDVRGTASVQIQLHRGQHDQDEGATLTATVVHS